MKIQELPIDDRLKSKLLEQGIEELYPPQADAVEHRLLEDQNIVVAIPTASGKTLIAILAIFSSLLKSPGSKAIYLAPLRALASEKYLEFKEYADQLGLKVAISTGDMDEVSGWLGSADIIIATNEKFDSLIRHQVSWLNDISVVVSDEIHLINDSHRGPVLEVVLTLLRRNLPDCQIVALSATIINADEIADWLEAELILSNWRPVKLKEAVWAEGTLYYGSGDKQEAGDPKDQTGFISLSREILQEGGQALVFANTRRSAMSTAETIGPKIFGDFSVDHQEKLLDLANQIRSVGEKTQMRERLAKAVQKGAAYHHAGLISAHRRIVENGFKDRIIQVIAATPTLAAGVNLPGRRVIIRSLSRYSPPFGYAPIPILEYKQMAGRAGRPRYDPYGEAIILAKDRMEVDEYLDRYVRAETEEISSKLATEPAMRAHILAFIASEYVDSFDSAMEMIAITFYGYQFGALNNFLVEENILRVFDLLIEAKLISVEEPYQITPFGQRVSELYLDPLSARLIKIGLQDRDEQDIPPIVYLQLLAMTPDIRTYSVRQKDMEKLVDIAEEYTDLWFETNSENSEFLEFDTDLFFTTIKIARVVDLWLEEASEQEIYQQFGVTSGDLHSILERTDWLVHCAAEIAKIFKWKGHRKALTSLQHRLKYGVTKELLDLVEIRGLGRIRARTLYDAGIKTVDQIKETSITRIASLPGFGERIAKRIKAEVEGVELEEMDDADGIISSNEKTRVQTSLSSFFD